MTTDDLRAEILRLHEIIERLEKQCADLDEVISNYREIFP